MNSVYVSDLLNVLDMRIQYGKRNFWSWFLKTIEKLIYVHTYIHSYIIGHYNPLVRIIDLVSHTTYVLCVLNLYICGGTYSLKSTPNDRFFEKLFMTILLTLRVFARNLLRGNRRRNNLRISFWCLAWDSNPGF